MRRSDSRDEAGGMRRVAVGIFCIAVAAAVVAAQEPAKPTAAVDLALSELDRAQLEILRLNEQLRLARAQRADCEATLGPLEATTRGADIQRAADELKRTIEARHPGTEYDLATGTLRTKPEPKKPDPAPATPKKDGKDELKR